MHDSLWRLLRGVYAQSLLLIATPALRFKDHGSIKVLETVVHENGIMYANVYRVCNHTCLEYECVRARCSVSCLLARSLALSLSASSPSPASSDVKRGSASRARIAPLHACAQPHSLDNARRKPLARALKERRLQFWRSRALLSIRGTDALLRS